MDQAALRKSWDVYLKNFGLVFGATILAAAVSAFSLGIASGPVMAGLAVLLLNLLRGHKADLNQIFSRFDKFLPTFLIMLVTGAACALLLLIRFIPVVGSILYPVAVTVLFAAAFYAIVGVVEHNQTFPGALQFGAGYLLSHSQALIAAAALGLAVGLVGLLFWVSWVLGLLFSWIVWLAYIFASPLFIVFLLNVYHESGVVTGEHKADGKAAQIVGICLAGLVVAGLLFYIIGGSSYTLGRARLRRAPGLGVIEGRTPGGGEIAFGVGVRLPDGFPKDVPIYPGATIFSSATGSDDDLAVVLNVDVSTSKVFNYYIDELSRRGWTIDEQTSTAFGSTVDAQKGSRKVAVLVLGSNEACTVTITIPRK